MLFLKSGSDLYWDGRKFQPDYRKGIVFGAMMGAEKDVRRASKIDPGCKLEVLNEEQWAEFTATVSKIEKQIKGQNVSVDV